MLVARRQLSVETIALFGMGALFFGIGGFMCATAYRTGHAPPTAAATVAALTPALPPALPPTADSDSENQPAPAMFAPAPAPTSIFGPPPDLDFPQTQPQPAALPAPERQERWPVPERRERATSPSIVLGTSKPFPLPRPIDLSKPSPGGAPGGRPVVASLGPQPNGMTQYDSFTAVYDLAAHTVYLPGGERLEAHSGLGALKDDPAHVDEKDRGATPPHLYDLTLREDLFHGVQALRLNPVGGAAEIFGRAGLLTHTYMLGPGGDSNGCVSFRNYDAFLQAFQSGRIKRLAVVSSLR